MISECFTINNCGYTFVSFYGIQPLVQEFYESSDQTTNWKSRQREWRFQMRLLQKVFDPVVQWKPRISISFATIKTVQQCCSYTFLFICIIPLTLLDLSSEQVVHGSIEWIGLSKMQLYSKSLFFELVKWNFGSSIVLVSF